MQHTHYWHGLKKQRYPILHRYYTAEQLIRYTIVPLPSRDCDTAITPPGFTTETRDLIARQQTWRCRCTAYTL